jgi:hypothetical protein
METPQPGRCEPSCTAANRIDELNRSCYCIGVDVAALRQRLEAEIGQRGLGDDLLRTHPHLFASQPLFVSRGHVEQMAAVMQAVESVVALPGYVQAALAWAPEIARVDHGMRGGLLGYDFHLGDAGPQLIEINTNPGGALLNVMLAEAQRYCCGMATDLSLSSPGVPDVTQEIFATFLAEWRAQRGAQPLRTVAIVDEDPAQQYLYPEFQLYRQLFERNGLEAIICDPRELEHVAGALRHRGQRIDLVYNRLTDFALQAPTLQALRSAYVTGDVVLSSHPRAHALYADKRNLTLLGDAAALRSFGCDERVIETLTAGIPRTEIVTAENRDAMWARRRSLFFKPAGGYGSKAAYRGDKLTRRVWDEMRAGTYVAQAWVAPSQRQAGTAAEPTTLKVDVRNFVYAGRTLLVAARLYQGQTTNFRTAGGGFAAVLTDAPVAADSRR